MYYSQGDERGESRHVFLEANDLSQRWQQAAGKPGAFTIAEIGFGSALNFLQTWQLWKQCPHKPASLHYLGFEKYPLARRDLEKMQRRWPELAELGHRLQSLYFDHSSGCHRLLLEDDVQLDLVFGDARSALENVPNNPCRVAAWYLDGFSPGLNPELWQTRLFTRMAELSEPGATVSTYSAAGKVRRRLQEAGFQVEKRPGFGRKRHMLVGRKCASTELASKVQPQSQDPLAPAPGITEKPGSWFTYPVKLAPRRDAVIIGAGLAGASLAFSLARRGWQVTVIDSSDSVAAGASGNSQLALRCRLFQNESPASRFFLQAYLFARTQFEQLSKAGTLDFQPSAVMQLHNAMHKQQGIDPFNLQRLYAEQVVTTLTQLQASATAGVQLSDAACHFPLGGWLDAKSLCLAYLTHPNIQLQLQQRVGALQWSGFNWLVKDQDGQHLGAAEVIALANGYGAVDLAQAAWLPLLAVRGQTSRLAASESSRSLNTVVCGERTVFPEHDGYHTLAASYHREELALDVRDPDNQHNLLTARTCFNDPAYLGEIVASGRVSLRCNTPDFLPVVGMLPNAAAMHTQFAGFARNARAEVGKPGCYYPGLYISAAHGSNGLASCPLSSEYLASLIDNEVPPLDQKIMNELNPARFLIRALKIQRQAC